MGRAPCCDKANVKKGPWSPEEDAKLKDHIHQHGTGGNWITLPQKAGLRRCGKSCRLRWLNYLRPNIRHGEFSEDEDRIICALFSTIGSRWSIIAGQLPGRTDNDIKNYWNTKLKKKLMATPLISSAFDHPPPITIPIPISIPSSLLTNHMTFMNNYSQVKDHDRYFLAFGGETSSCSSDGSTSTANQIISSHDDLEYRLPHQFQDYQKPIDHHHGDDQLMMDYSSLEEIKQLISTNSCNNSMSLFVEEIKAEDKFMY